MPQFDYDNNLDSLIHSCRKKHTCKGLLIASCNESRKPKAHGHLVKHRGHITAIQDHTVECARIRLKLAQQRSETVYSIQDCSVQPVTVDISTTLSSTMCDRCRKYNTVVLTNAGQISRRRKFRKFHLQTFILSGSYRRAVIGGKARLKLHRCHVNVNVNVTPIKSCLFLVFEG